MPQKISTKFTDFFKKITNTAKTAPHFKEKEDEKNSTLKTRNCNNRNNRPNLTTLAPLLTWCRSWWIALMSCSLRGLLALKVEQSQGSLTHGSELRDETYSVLPSKNWSTTTSIGEPPLESSTRRVTCQECHKQCALYAFTLFHQFLKHTAQSTPKSAEFNTTTQAQNTKASGFVKILSRSISFLRLGKI